MDLLSASCLPVVAEPVVGQIVEAFEIEAETRKVEPFHSCSRMVVVAVEEENAVVVQDGIGTGRDGQTSAEVPQHLGAVVGVVAAVVGQG